MEILYPAGVWAAVLVCLSVLGAHALRMRTEKNYREAWGSATLALIPAALFWLFIVSGEADMLRRTILVLPAGALVGACLFAYAGYFLHDIRAARAEGVTMNSRQALVAAMNDLATAIENSPGVVIGSQSIAIGQPGSSGTVIGSQSIAIGQPGNTGTVIGSVSSASSSGTPVNPQKATAIRQGAERVKSGSASKAEISAVIAQSHLPGINPLLNAAVARANQALQASDLP